MSSNFCTLCGSNQFDFFLESTGIIDKKKYTLIKCRECGIVRTPEFGNIDYTPDLNYHYSENQKSLFEKIEFFYIQARWKQEVKFLKKFLPDNALLLDAGSGNGIFLDECKNMGIHAEGIEKYINLMLTKKNSLRVYQLDMESDELPNHDYDCVTLFHSLEHMREPHKVLQKIRGVLKKDGLLLIQVPNIDSWQFLIFKSHWFHLFLPYHRYHFNTRTLKKLLLNNRFSVTYERHFSNRWNMEGWSASILKWNPVYFLQKRSERMPLKKLIYLLLTIIFIPVSLLESALKKGGVITLIARKVN